MSDESTPYVYALLTEEDMIGLFSSPQEARKWAEENHVVFNGVTRILHRAGEHIPESLKRGARS